MKAFNQNSANVSLGKRQSKDSCFFYPIHYKASGKGNWYQQDLEYFDKPSFPPQSLPEKIQLEYCFNAKIHAEYLMTFQNENGMIKALTGLREVLIPDWYYGDLRSFHEGETITSLILLQFSPDRSMFRIYLFQGYYPNGKKKKNSILKTIREILATGRPPRQIEHKIKPTISTTQS